MEIQRTANAGVLLKMDGVSILLDGLCEEIVGYLPTPAAIAQNLLCKLPDVLLFTHNHADHCSETLLLPYRRQKLRPIFGPESLYTGPMRVGDVTITPISSRHIGKNEPGLQHVSYIIEGSKCVWFTGDAAPLQWKDRFDLPKADVIIAPYAYCNTTTSVKLTQSLANKLVLLHLPNRDNDPYQLWLAVEDTIKQCTDLDVWIPEIGETVYIN